jgi:hypothetical protein
MLRPVDLGEKYQISSEPFQLEGMAKSEQKNQAYV